MAKDTGWLTIDKDALNYEEVTMAFEKESVLVENLKDLMGACREELLDFIVVCKNEKLNIPFNGLLLPAA